MAVGLYIERRKLLLTTSVTIPISVCELRFSAENENKIRPVSVCNLRNCVSYVYKTICFALCGAIVQQMYR